MVFLHLISIQRRSIFVFLRKKILSVNRIVAVLLKTPSNCLVSVWTRFDLLTYKHGKPIEMLYVAEQRLEFHSGSLVNSEKSIVAAIYYFRFRRCSNQSPHLTTHFISLTFNRQNQFGPETTKAFCHHITNWHTDIWHSVCMRRRAG